MVAVPPVEPAVPGSDLGSEQEQDDDVVESAVSGSGGAGEPRWLPPVLRMLAEMHCEVATRISTRPRATLTNLKFDEFRGGRETKTRQHRSWQKQARIAQHLHGLSDPEMALMMHTQAKGRAKQLLEVFEATDVEQPGGLNMVWAMLDRAHERVDCERADDLYAEWESAHRRVSQSFAEWLTYLRKTKLELEAQD